MNNALASWEALNTFLRSANERSCRDLLLAERKGRNRMVYKLRIFGKYNKLRAARERQELVTRDTMRRDYEKGNWG